jgi:hypothetical protein
MSKAAWCVTPPAFLGLSTILRLQHMTTFPREREKNIRENRSDSILQIRRKYRLHTVYTEKPFTFLFKLKLTEPREFHHVESIQVNSRERSTISQGSEINVADIDHPQSAHQASSSAVARPGLQRFAQQWSSQI